MFATNLRPCSQPSGAVGRLSLMGYVTRVVDPMWRSLVPCISSAETHVLALRLEHQRSERSAVPHWWLRLALHSTVDSPSFEGGSWLGVPSPLQLGEFTWRSCLRNTRRRYSCRPSRKRESPETSGLDEVEE